MLLFKSSAYLAALFLPSIAVCADGPAGQLQIGQESMQVGLHEPVIVDMTVFNPAQAPIIVDFGINFVTEYRFVATFPDGHQIQGPELPLDLGGVPGMVKIQPGKSYTHPLLLNEWISFDRIGSYAVQFELSGVQNRPTLRLAVGLRDINRLHLICVKLTKQATEGPLDQALWPAKVLSHVADSIAVPYLVTLSKRPGMDRIAVMGLANVGNRKAVAEIDSLLDRSHDEVLIRVARRDLRDIRARTHNELLKTEVDRILSKRQDLDYKVVR